MKNSSQTHSGILNPRPANHTQYLNPLVVSKAKEEGDRTKTERKSKRQTQTEEVNLALPQRTEAPVDSP